MSDVLDSYSATFGNFVKDEVEAIKQFQETGKVSTGENMENNNLPEVINNEKFQEISSKIVFEKDSEVFTTSLKIAEVFEKDHYHVLEAIREKIANLKELSLDFSGPTFRGGEIS